MHEATLTSALVPSPVEYSVLLPPDADAGPLPLLLLLHGGGGDRSFLAQMEPLIRSAWADGHLPPLAVATPSAERSFYLDYRDGSQRWESFLADELLPALRARHPVTQERDGTLAAGISMGGMGALRLAFRRPEQFAAVAALEPGIEPALEFSDVELRDRLYREPEVYEERFGRPIDGDYWRENTPAWLARANALRIQQSGLQIYLECGDEDGFALHHGAEFLHRILWDAGIQHEYRLVRGADHLGSSLGPRFLDALGFLGRVLNPPPADFPGAPVPLADFQKMIAGLRATARYVPCEKRLVNAGAAHIQVNARGSGRNVVLLPSLGRGAADFDDLAERLARAGCRALAPWPRGIGGSSGPLDGITLHDLAADVAAVIEALDAAPAVVVGHAFGNRVARTLASDRPDLVERVVLVAAGGLVAPEPEVRAALASSFNLYQPPAQHLGAVARAFFAKANDAAVWRDGWHPEVAAMQSLAGQATPLEDWWSAGRAPILAIQGLEDAVAPPENGHRLREQHGERVTVVDLPDAGHALLPEQPEAIVQAILDYITDA